MNSIEGHGGAIINESVTAVPRIMMNGETGIGVAAATEIH